MRSFIPGVLVLLIVLAAGCGDIATGPDRDARYAQPSAIGVWAPGSPGECDPWLDINWCEDDGGCMTSAPLEGSDELIIQSCGPGGGAGAGGGGTSPPPDDPAPDTCNTGDPIVDDPDVSKGLAGLWLQSNPDANLAQRVEKAGWIVEYPAGQYSVVQWTGGVEKFGCGDYANLQLPSQGTVVGFVHTHPYEVGESITDCNFASVQTYDGTPSDYDRRASVALGTYLGRSGPLAGYIIDKDGYYRYDGHGNTAAPRRPRCGY